MYAPLPPFVLKELAEVKPGKTTHTDYFSWSGTGLPETVANDWRKKFMDAVRKSKFHRRGHPHMVRDTFAAAQLSSQIGKQSASRSVSDGATEVEYTIVAPQGGVKGLGRVFWFTVMLRLDSASKLMSKRLLLSSNANQCCSAEVWELSSTQGESPSDDFKVARYDPYRIIVHVGSAAPAEQRSATWDWQMSCLTSFVGCDDVRRILPSIHPFRQ